MAFSGKMISRITKTTASSTHTANAIRAHTNGGFSHRGTSVNSRSLTRTNSPAKGYGYSHIGQKRNKYSNEVTQRDYDRLQQLRGDEYHVGYGRSSDVDITNRQEANARAEQGGLSNRMAGTNSRFEASRVSGGRFGGAGGNGGAASRFGSTPPPRMSGAANATARPVPKPNFRRPS